MQIVYIYSMDAAGRVKERRGIVQRHKRGSGFIIVTLENGQKMVLPEHAGEIQKDAMWARTAQKNVYVKKMLDILYERWETYRGKMESTTRKIHAMRECVS